MINVLINDYDMFNDFGLILTYRKIGVAQPNIYNQSIPGMNGVLDYTSFFGELTYKNRPIELVFSKKNENDTQQLKYQLEMLFNGKEAKIVFSDDEQHYWKGRISFSNNDDDTYLYEINAEIDAYPFKFNISDDSEVRSYV